MRTFTFLLALAAIGCRQGDSGTDSTPIDDTGPAVDDADGDGSAADVDCDDTDAAVHPGAAEICNDIDDDCDGSTDEDATDASTLYGDGDGDGYGETADTITSCDDATGYAKEGGDCDDADPAVHPGASEDDCADPTDYNCDGSVGFSDGDGDGVAACEDCDDTNAAINPSAEETCNGYDDDCDGESDEAGATGGSTFYADADGDGYGGASDTTEACAAPTGYAADASDCDDATATTYPGAAESCNGTDDDCDGETDEGATDLGTFYADTDGDGYGDPAVSEQACAAPVGFVSDASDCDDAAAGSFPGATEACDGVDGDCDGSVPADEADADGDGARGCGGDCDDADAAVGPGADELCDDVDSDCDGETKDADATDAITFYADGDGDGYGDAGEAQTACEAPTGYAAEKDDCDDADPAVHPAAAETCNTKDDDCDGTPDNDEDVLGDGADCAADACGDILAARSGAKDAAYFLLLPSGKTQKVWCDMKGGGWTLAFVKNSIDDQPIFVTGTGGYQYGKGYQQPAQLAGNPLATSRKTETRKIRSWLDLNEFEYTHLRLTAWHDGKLTYTSDPLKKSDMNIKFGENGYHAYNLDSDPPRLDGQKYWWCGGERNYTDYGVGQVNRPSGAPADCKNHGSVGSGWDFSRSAGTNAGLTLCGAAGASNWMHAEFGTIYYSYPTPGAAQAIWVK